MSRNDVTVNLCGATWVVFRMEIEESYLDSSRRNHRRRIGRWTSFFITERRYLLQEFLIRVFRKQTIDGL